MKRAARRDPARLHAGRGRAAAGQAWPSAIRLHRLPRQGRGRAAPDSYRPRIAGKPALYLFNQLVNFREGGAATRPWSTSSTTSSDDYLREIAEHFAVIEALSRAGRANDEPAALALGEKLAPSRATKRANCRPARPAAAAARPVHGARSHSRPAGRLTARLPEGNRLGCLRANWPAPRRAPFDCMARYIAR